MYLNIENLVKFYNKENPLIKDLNFTVNKGEFVSFIGESGSGKSVTALSILQLLSYPSAQHSDSSSIFVDIYVHSSAIITNPSYLEVGEQVSFMINPEERCAIEVRSAGKSNFSSGRTAGNNWKGQSLECLSRKCTYVAELSTLTI